MSSTAKAFNADQAAFVQNVCELLDAIDFKVRVCPPLGLGYVVMCFCFLRPNPSFLVPVLHGDQIREAVDMTAKSGLDATALMGMGGGGSSSMGLGAGVGVASGPSTAPPVAIAGAPGPAPATGMSSVSAGPGPSSSNKPVGASSVFQPLAANVTVNVLQPKRKAPAPAPAPVAVACTAGPASEESKTAAAGVGQEDITDGADASGARKRHQTEAL